MLDSRIAAGYSGVQKVCLLSELRNAARCAAAAVFLEDEGCRQRVDVH
jgi:hypothetical protein